MRPKTGIFFLALAALSAAFGVGPACAGESAGAAISAVARVEQPTGLTILSDESSLTQNTIGPVLHDPTLSAGKRLLLRTPRPDGILIQIKNSASVRTSASVSPAPGEPCILPGPTNQTVILDISKIADLPNKDKSPVIVTIIYIDN